MTQLISFYFEADHKRLDALYNQFIAQQGTRQASAYFHAFRQGLEQHIRWEESVLFPFFEQKTGMNQGPTRVMTIEHQEIVALNSQISEQLEHQQPIAPLLHRLESLLSEHNDKEEQVLYPMLDQRSSEEEKAALFLQITQL
ncbi:MULTISPECIES: hemerythrin domain-containing protein [unclassified Pseudoalteromonas]|uniref:hemerythrin domain-containing protein n=1 Tax=unclassified Pseudoalteromonas TaxID=194690 RepID=UPI000CF5FB28|nr:MULTISPECIES: hemerythrin domain-containing protein [unclassified Pseudoalteromonas]MBS3798040.1 hemerythrin domain-containing protein [Pseudoalteromonas sp. BDTF-M6]